MTYRDMLAALYAARRFGVRFELERVRASLAAVGAPERRLGAVVHVGGTNGKGSTAAMVEATLRAAGLRTGLYTSPHLARFTERVRVAGEELDGEALAARWAAWRGAIGEMTFFEQATILALGVFADARVDATVLEVGLGGRLDATNVVDADVAVVTGVALDHQEHLGPDLASIAREKAGIFKPGRRAVVGRAGEPEARERLVALAREAGVAEVIEAGEDAPEGWAVGLGGEHQRRNAACALAALDALERATDGRVAVPEAARRAGLAGARWPGRLEEVSAAPRIWLDAAHNPHGAAALARALPEGARVLAVAGVSADKDVAGVLAPVAARAARLWATTTPNPRALAAEALARVAAGIPGPAGRAVEAEPDPHRAVARAAAAVTAGEGDLVVVFGSIFLCGAVRARLLGEPEDPIAAQDPIGTQHSTR